MGCDEDSDGTSSQSSTTSESNEDQFASSASDWRCAMCGCDNVGRSTCISCGMPILFAIGTVEAEVETETQLEEAADVERMEKEDNLVSSVASIQLPSSQLASDLLCKPFFNQHPL